jgi:hypothetical protein
MVFGRWIPLDEAVAPDGPGLFQVRYDQGSSGLVAYPTGTSAMVFYGADDHALGAALGRFRDGADPAQRHRLHVRFAAPDPGRPPSSSLARSLERFAERFGAPPLWNRP